ncbi:tyrosine-type recombinase/integrase [Azospirillum halopraeferens]|uniref:tyrosine-type recombinase/integrase n=1 Tax=Azospirillum halopraeferens TaxID=34010 RepID=UPI00146F988D
MAGPYGILRVVRSPPSHEVDVADGGKIQRTHRRAICAHAVACHGEPIGTIETGLNSAAGRTGIPDCTPHALRHTAAMRMAGKGVPLCRISGILGHPESRITELYAHHHPDHRPLVRERSRVQSSPATPSFLAGFAGSSSGTFP